MNPQQQQQQTSETSDTATCDMRKKITEENIDEPTEEENISEQPVEPTEEQEEDREKQPVQNVESDAGEEKHYSKYRSKVTNMSGCLPCGHCGELICISKYEKHLSDKHQLDSTCPWCGLIDWPKGQKMKNAKHLLECMEKTVAEKRVKNVQRKGLKRKLAKQEEEEKIEEQVVAESSTFSDDTTSMTDEYYAESDAAYKYHQYDQILLNYLEGKRNFFDAY